MKGRQSGFTLFELMFAIAIAAVVLGLAAPSLAELTRGNRLSASSREFVLDFMLARNEAVMRAQNVTVCTSSDLDVCDGSGWTGGRLVFVDVNGDGVVDAGDTVLTRTEALDDSLTAAATGAAAANRITFMPNGRVQATSRLTVCAAGRPARQIDVHRTGQATLNVLTTLC